MEKTKRIFFLIYSLSIAGICTFVPLVIYSPSRSDHKFLGHFPVWYQPPNYSNISIDLTIIVLEIVASTALFLAAYIGYGILSPQKQSKGSDKEA